MLEVLSKPLDEITIADIRSLIDLDVPEGEQIEFKRELMGGKDSKGREAPDPWMTGGNKIGSHAKKDILKGVVALANAYGGVLLIGIDESNSKPAVADKISPVPRCADLAERLKLVFRDGVDPQLTRIEIKGFPTKGECGVVIIRVGRSRLAPHRVKQTLICPIRRADRSEPMTMREIQDMTLNVSRGLERLDKRLSERSERFKKEFDRLVPHENSFGIRLTAAPVVDEIGFDRVFQQRSVVQDLDIPQHAVIQKSPNDERTLSGPPELSSSSSPLFWRPLLRGARAELYPPLPDEPLLAFGYREVYCDGLVELGFVSIVDGASYLLCDPDWPIAMFADLAVWADHIRKQAEAPTVEYALVVEMCNPGNAGLVCKAGVYQTLSRMGRKLPPLPDAEFPRYSLKDSSQNPGEIAELLALFYRDFWHSMGKDQDATFTFNP